MTLTEKIIEEFKKKFTVENIGDTGYLHSRMASEKYANPRDIAAFLLSSLRQVATEAIEAVKLEKRETNNYKSSHNAVMHSHIDTGYNSAISEMEQKAKKFLENL